MMREHVPRLALVALGTLPVDPPATAGVIQRRSPARHATIPAHSPSARRTRTRRAVEDEFTRLRPVATTIVLDACSGERFGALARSWPVKPSFPARAA